MQLSKKELNNLIIASIIAGVVFFLREWRTTDHNLPTGLTSLFGFMLICSFIYLIYIFSEKLMALKSSCKAEFNLITTKKIISNNVPKPLQYSGPIITLLVSFLSLGGLLFIALASFETKVNRKQRIGHKWTNLKEFEEATIAFAGPLSNLILLIIFKLLLPLSPLFFSKAMFIASALTIFHLLPLPKFDGLRIFMGSMFLYLFAVALAILLIILVYLTNIFLALVLALIIATSITLYFFYQSRK